MRQSFKTCLFTAIPFLATLTVLFSCAPHTAQTGRSAPARHARPSISAAALEKQVHTLINNERRKAGLSLLASDEALSRIARNHSRDMGTRSYFAHNSPEGHDFSYRYQQAGYTCAITISRTIYQGAENIARNNLYDSVTTVNGQAYYDWNSLEKIAETTVQGWMKSPGHRKNILTPVWRNEGIGVFISPDDRVYITQNFC